MSISLWLQCTHLLMGTSSESESQDLIPAEHLWCDFKCRLWAKNPSPNTNDIYTHTHTHIHTVNTDRELTHTHTPWTHTRRSGAIYAVAPREQLGVRCLAQGYLSCGIEGGESAVHSFPPLPASLRFELATFRLRVWHSKHKSTISPAG